MKRSGTSTLLINGQAVSLRGAAPNLGAADNRLGTVYAESGDFSGTLNVTKSDAVANESVATVGGVTFHPKLDNVAQKPGIKVGQFFAQEVVGGHAAAGFDYSTCLVWVGGQGVAVPIGRYVGWGSSGNGVRDVSSSWADLRLYRDSAGQLAQRNGLNPQSFAVYGTHTDAINYERARLYGQAGGAFTLASEAAGTGSQRGLTFTAGASLSLASQTVTLATGTGYTLVFNNSGFSQTGAAVSLGTSANRWSTVYATTVDASTKLSLGTEGAYIAPGAVGTIYRRPIEFYLPYNGGDPTLGVQFGRLQEGGSPPFMRFPASDGRILGVTAMSLTTLELGHSSYGIGRAGGGLWTTVGGFSGVRITTSPGVTTLNSLIAKDIRLNDLATLRSDAANVLTLRNALNPQQIELYGTYTDPLNYERVRLYGDGTAYHLVSEAAGTGTVRPFNIGKTSGHHFHIPTSGPMLAKAGVSEAFYWDDGTVRFSWAPTPKLTGATNLGRSDLRWGTAYATAGDFSGGLTVAGGITATGLPTADPLVAGQIWNDLGTLKISAG